MARLAPRDLRLRRRRRSVERPTPIEIPSGPPEAVARFTWLLREQARITVRTTEADGSDWNGTVLQSTVSRASRGTRQPHPLSAAWDDGTLQFDRDRVVRPLWELCCNGGRQQDDKTLERWALALAAVYHENLHLLREEGRCYSEGMRAYARLEVKAVEEATVALWVADEQRRFLEAVDAEAWAPGITRVKVRDSPHQRFLPAVTAWIDALSEDSGLSRTEVLRDLVRCDPGRKFPRAAEITASGRALRDLIPAQDRDRQLRRLQHAMELGLRRGLAARLPDAGDRAVQEYRAEIDAIRATFTLPPDLSWINEVRRTAFVPPSPSPEDRGRVAGDRPRAAPSPGQYRAPER